MSYETEQREARNRREWEARRVAKAADQARAVAYGLRVAAGLVPNACRRIDIMFNTDLRERDAADAAARGDVVRLPIRKREPPPPPPPRAPARQPLPAAAQGSDEIRKHEAVREEVERLVASLSPGDTEMLIDLCQSVLRT